METWLGQCNVKQHWLGCNERVLSFS
jgi:hypothetical protein